MPIPENLVVRRIIRTVADNPDLYEVEVTQRVTEDLKRKKKGLFQNEVDYRVLFPDFGPPPSKKRASGRFRADLVGFSQDGFTVLELKIYDELWKNKNPWGVQALLSWDRVKLEAAIQANTRGLEGDVITVSVVRNADFRARPEQVRKMLAHAGKKRPGGRNPPLQSATYFPILEVVRRRAKALSNVPWQYTTHRSKGTAFLVGRANLRPGDHGRHRDGKLPDPIRPHRNTK